MASEIAVNPHFSRPNWAQIDLDALRHNARAIARHVAPARLIAVVKANAYGHGALQIARALEEVEAVTMLAVASVDEARHLREGGIQTPILLLSAILPVEAREVVQLGLTPTVWTPDVACALENEAQKQNRRLKIHFKVDTGMHRIGVDWREASHALEPLCNAKNLEIEAVYTHFACADQEFETEIETEIEDFNALQLQRFDEFCAQNPRLNAVRKHAANSAGVLRFSDSHFDWVRPGLALYGANPCRNLTPEMNLKPVMTWHARITALKNVARGEGVSYGQIWTARRDSRIAVLPAGYADGYLRSLSNCGEVLVGGAGAPVVGRVTMDQILVDVTGLEAQIGDVATLWGENMPVENVAERAGTIAYELLCGVAPRVPRVIIGEKISDSAREI